MTIMRNGVAIETPRYYLFGDEYGEDFIVEGYNQTEAEEVAQDVCSDIYFIREVSEEFAESSGLEVYC